jgi:chorismate--pyruvate lyase
LDARRSCSHVLRENRRALTTAAAHAHARPATSARRLGDAALLSMLTLTAAPRAPPALQRRVANRRAQRGRGAAGGARAVLKNGGLRNGDAARRGDDERAGDETPRHHSSRRSFRGSPVATDGARADAPRRAFRSDEKSAPPVVPDEPLSRFDEAEEVFFQPEDSDVSSEDDVPLYRALALERADAARDTVPHDTSPRDTRSRWPALVETAAEFDEASAMRRGAVAPLVAPPWRVMLLSDGSVTRHLTLLTDAKVRVDVLDQRLVRPGDVAADPSVPADVVDVLTRDGFRTSAASSRVAKVVHREVDLCDGASGSPLVYASSWWTEEAAIAYGIVDADTGFATSRPVWFHLSDKKTELYREVRRVYLGNAPKLEAAWNVRGPFWARHYIFWAGDKPLCVIYEVFSPELERFLGARTAGTGAEDKI